MEDKQQEMKSEQEQQRNNIGQISVDRKKKTCRLPWLKIKTFKIRITTILKMTKKEKKRRQSE